MACALVYDARLSSARCLLVPQAELFTVWEYRDPPNMLCAFVLVTERAVSSLRVLEQSPKFSRHSGTLEGPHQHVLIQACLPPCNHFQNATLRSLAPSLLQHLCGALIV